MNGYSSGTHIVTRGGYFLSSLHLLRSAARDARSHIAPKLAGRLRVTLSPIILAPIQIKFVTPKSADVVTDALQRRPQ